MNESLSFLSPPSFLSFPSSSPLSSVSTPFTLLFLQLQFSFSTLPPPTYILSLSFISPTNSSSFPLFYSLSLSFYTYPINPPFMLLSRPSAPLEALNTTLGTCTRHLQTFTAQTLYLCIPTRLPAPETSWVGAC